MSGAGGSGAGGAVRVAQALLEATCALRGEEARFEAELLLGHALRRDRAWLYAHANDAIDGADLLRLQELVESRRRGVPVAHLTGSRGFWTLRLAVTPATLIPRPDTELLVEAALARLPARQPCRIADLGTGTGAVALAIAAERPQASVIASDISADALAVARCNAIAAGLRNIEFREGDWLQPLAGERFALIASNPPYLGEGDPHLGEGDLRFEPALALVSGADGLDALRRITATAPTHLLSGGWLLVEHGWQQGAAVRGLFASAGFDAIETLADLAQRERVTLGRFSASG